jgi:hypothetical protein
MLGTQPPQDAGSMQEIVHRRVDRHQGPTELTPERPLLTGAQQHRRQRHRQDLVGNAVDVAQRTDDGLAQGRKPIRRLGIHRTELCIDPGDEIAVGDIAHEQEQAVGHLVQVAVAQRLARQWAGGDVARLRAGAGSFTVLTVVEPPVAAELGQEGLRARLALMRAQRAWPWRCM